MRVEVTMRVIVEEICNLRPSTLSSRAVKAVQKRINTILARLGDRYTSAAETDKWSIANACAFARGEIGRGKTAAQAVSALAS